MYEVRGVTIRWGRKGLSFPFAIFIAVICLGASVSTTAIAAESRTLASIHARLTCGAPVTIVCLGDSVTAVQYHSGGRRAYPELLAETLRRRFPVSKLRVINAGVSGNDTLAALNRMSRDVLAHQPDLVTVMFGLNDIANLTPTQFHDNLTEIVGRIQASGCNALICTPNSIEDTSTRRMNVLATYVDVARRVGKERRAPIADAFSDFERVRRNGENDFDELFSDPIHPNLEGHKRLAAAIVKAIIGCEIGAGDNKPLEPALPHICKQVASEQPIKVLAMPPYDGWVASAITKAHPQASVHVLRWDVAGKTLCDIAREADQVRVKRPDLVIVAIPIAPYITLQDRFARLYCDVLSRSFSYVNQEWDVLALPPSLERPITPGEQSQNEWSTRLIQAFDMPRVARGARDARPGRQLFDEWITEQLSDCRE